MSGLIAIVQSMSKYLLPHEIAKHVGKLQGTMKDTEFANSINITRQALRTIKAGLAIPNVRTRGKLGLELTYKVVPTTEVAPVSAVPAKTAAKKAAKKTAIL